MSKRSKKRLKLKGTYKMKVDYVVLVPPPTSFKNCPRCGLEHTKVKPKKFTKPMDFYGKDKDGKKDVLTGRASNWALCPKTKEPIIFFDRYITAENIEDVLAKNAADDIAHQIDKEVLAELKALSESAKASDTKPMQQQITVKYELGPGQAWVYDPNAPARMVPGTKKQAAEQRARAKAQEAKVKGKKR